MMTPRFGLVGEGILGRSGESRWRLTVPTYLELEVSLRFVKPKVWRRFLI